MLTTTALRPTWQLLNASSGSVATSLMPRPIRMKSTPISIAMPATPKATTEVNNEA